jgi:hypothetical protein
MFHDLDSTVAELLRRTLPPDLVRQVSLTFATPDGKFPPSAVALPAVDLFLYALRENRDLRDTEPTFERRGDGTVVRTPPPIRVDCHYLVTAWPRTGDTADQDEHRLLGEVMIALARFPQIPEQILQGSMKQQPLAISTAVLRAAEEQRGDFWQALGGKPKAAFDYRVTIAVDTGLPDEAGRLVTFKRI